MQFDFNIDMTVPEAAFLWFAVLAVVVGVKQAGVILNGKLGVNREIDRLLAFAGHLDGELNPVA